MAARLGRTSQSDPGGLIGTPGSTNEKADIKVVNSRNPLLVEVRNLLDLNVRRAHIGGPVPVDQPA